MIISPSYKLYWSEQDDVLSSGNPIRNLHLLLIFSNVKHTRITTESQVARVKYPLFPYSKKSHLSTTGDIYLVIVTRNGLSSIRFIAFPHGILYIFQSFIIHFSWST